MLESGRYVLWCLRNNVTWQHARFLDCSIAPGNVGANTYNTAIAIGEKAAVLIAEDLGIRVV